MKRDDAIETVVMTVYFLVLFLVTIAVGLT